MATDGSSQKTGGNLQPTTDLQALADEIREAHAELQIGARHVLMHANVCGGLLLRAKAAVGHGGFMDWVQEHCGISHRTATRYIKIHENWESLESNWTDLANLNFTTALRIVDGTYDAASPSESSKPEAASESQPDVLLRPVETAPQKPDVKSEPEIPSHLQRIFEGLPKWKEAHAHYGKLRSLLLEISRLHPENGIRVMDMQPIDTLLTELYGLMTTVEPTKICPTCKGKNCEACGSRGYLIKGRVPHRPITFPNMLETTN